MHRLLPVPFVLFFLMLTVDAAAADAAAGKASYAVCAACHGQDALGNPSLNAPKIAGLEPWYLARQLKAFKDGIRGAAPGDVYGAQMRPMMATLADQAAIDNVVAYITSLPTKPSPVTIQGDANAGKALYNVCAACHGQKAEGNAQLNSPRLAGQNDWYLARQLDAFKKGLRGAHPQDTYGAQMKPMAATLTTDQATKDVVAYINSLQ
jgi:cytochrome c oxidase subunit 2